MDLLAPIFAYFGTVTAMIVAVVMSYDAFVYTPLHPPIPQHAVNLAAKPIAAKAAAKPAAKIARLSRVVADPVRGDAVGSATARQAHAAAKRRAARGRNAIARQQQMRWLSRQARVREWAYEQAPEAPGYADEPANGFGYDRFQ